MEAFIASINQSLYWKSGICLLIIFLTCIEVWIFSRKNCIHSVNIQDTNIHKTGAAGGGKLVYIAALNVSGALGVVLLHANNVFWTRPTGTLWLSSNFIETFFYWPVPIFFMITGATLIDYLRKYSTMVYFRKRVGRTFLPFIFWSLFACAFSVIYRGSTMDWNILHIVSNIFNTKYLQVYWFFPALFSIYLSIPLLTLVGDKLRAFRYVIIVGLIANMSLPLLCSIVHIPYNGQLRLDVAGGSLLYVLTGYYLSRTEFTARQRAVIYVCGVAGWLIHYFGTLVASAEQTSVVRLFKGYSNFPAFIQAVAVFVFFRYLFAKHQISEQAKSLLFRLSGLTFGIYLIHRYFLIVLLKEMSIDDSSMMWRIAGAMFVFILSAHIVMLIKKIPLVRKTVP